MSDMSRGIRVSNVSNTLQGRSIQPRASLLQSPLPYSCYTPYPSVRPASRVFAGVTGAKQRRQDDSDVLREMVEGQKALTRMLSTLITRLVGNDDKRKRRKVSDSDEDSDSGGSSSEDMAGLTGRSCGDRGGVRGSQEGQGRPSCEEAAKG